MPPSRFALMPGRGGLDAIEQITTQSVATPGKFSLTNLCCSCVQTHSRRPIKLIRDKREAERLVGWSLSRVREYVSRITPTPSVRNVTTTRSKITHRRSERERVSGSVFSPIVCGETDNGNKRTKHKTSTEISVWPATHLIS